MKMKLLVAQGVILLFACFSVTAFVSSASAAPSLWIQRTPTSGQFNNGLISPTGPGITEATTKLYYLSSSQATSRPRAGMTLRGSGFEPNKSVAFGIVGQQGEPTEPWGTGNVSLPAPITADENGEFEYSMIFSRAAPSSYNKFDGFGGEKLIVYPRYLDTAGDDNPDGRIPGVQVTLTITPTVIVLPRTLNPITMYAGADYGFSPYTGDGGVAAMIIDDSSRAVRLAIAGMTLREAGRELSRENDTWTLPNGVTASSNVDNSYIVLRTPSSGAAEELGETFSIFGTGASVIDDGFASVVGFPKTSDTQIATFNLQVKKSGRSIRPKFDSLTFTNNETANASIEFKADPSNLTISDLRIVNPETGEKTSSLTAFGGLVLTTDPEYRQVSFSGVPSLEGGTGEATYQVVWITTDGEELPSSIKVNVSIGNVYVPSHNDTLIGDGYPEFWTKGETVEGGRNVSVSGADGESIPVILTVDSSAAELEGLDVTVQDNKRIVINGVPTFSGEKTFYVNISLDPTGQVSGTISPNRIPFTVFVDDAVYQLSFDTEKLSVPVGKAVHSNVHLFTEPKYERDMTPRDFILSGEGVTRNENGFWSWNGLEIASWINTATWSIWLEISGTAKEDASVELTYAPRRGNNMSSASFTIEAHKDENIPEVPDTAAIPNADDPVVTASDDVRIENPVAGETTKIVYVISENVSETINNTNHTYNNYVNVQTVVLQLPDGRTIPLSDLNDNTVINPFTGAPNSYYFDRANGQVVVYVTPEEVGDYVCHIYFRDPTGLKVQPVNLPVSVTKNYYNVTTINKGGGGCNAGISGLALLLAALVLTCGRRGR
jgi:hypothetical protein